MVGTKQIPGFSQGVRQNAAARMVKLGQPICPNSKVKMIRTPEGRWIADPNPDPARQNCQSDTGPDGSGRVGWWDACEQRGHDPYYTTRVWFSEEDEVDETTGEVTKTRRVRHEDRRPNIAQVAAHTRVNSGKGVVHKMERHGFRRLKDMGFEEVCQFRNCQNPVKVTSRYGLYCGNEHATLIAADAQGLMIHQNPPGVAWSLGNENHVRQLMARELADAQQFADIKPV